jgi:hypothetical protein
VSVRLLAVMLGRVLMDIARAVAGPHGGLLVRGGRPPVCASGIEMSLCSRVVGGYRALQRLISALPCPLGGLRGGRHTVSELGLPLLQLLGAGTGSFAACFRGFVGIGRAVTGSGHGQLRNVVWGLWP